MRDIKFRAYSSFLNRMFYSDQCKDLQEFFHNNLEDGLMQFTGAVDINDYDIYENDKVKDGLGNEFIVKYNEDFCAFMLYPSDGSFMAFYPEIKLEVIGNTLEGKK